MDNGKRKIAYVRNIRSEWKLLLCYCYIRFTCAMCTGTHGFVVPSFRSYASQMPSLHRSRFLHSNIQNALWNAPWKAPWNAPANPDVDKEKKEEKNQFQSIYY